MAVVTKTKPSLKDKRMTSMPQGRILKGHTRSATGAASSSPSAESDSDSSADAGDGEQDDESDSSTTEDDSSADEQQPDASALPSAHRDGMKPPNARLVGLDANVRMYDNENDAVTGAGHAVSDSDDDDDYDGIENANGSEESEDEREEGNVLRSAEQDLIEEFEIIEQWKSTSAVTGGLSDMELDDVGATGDNLSLRGNTFEAFDFAVNMDDDPFLGLSTQDTLYGDMLNDAEFAIWRMPDSTHSPENSAPIEVTHTQKRVRFCEEPARSASITSSEDPNDAFPDLFTDQDDPAVRRLAMLAADQDAMLLSADVADNESFYDFDDEDERLAFRLDEDSESDDDESSQCSDDDDDGDTTDEETVEEQYARLEAHRQASGRPPSSSSATPATATRRSVTVISDSGSRPVTPRRGKEPPAGTFAIDPTRATMSADPCGNSIKLYPPTKPLEHERAFWERARLACKSIDGALHNPRSSPSSSSATVVPPFTTKSTLGSMFDGKLGFIRNNEQMDAPNTPLVPSMITRPELSFGSLDESDTDQQDIDMRDFIDMDDTDSESDGMQTNNVTSPEGPSRSDSFGSHPDRKDSHNLLDHFDQFRGVVGSFRRNQHQAKHISSLALHPSKRASTHEYNALQKGRRGAANTPITPVRRKRVSQDLTSSGVRKSVGSPLTPRRQRSRGNSLINASPAVMQQTFTRNPLFE